MKKVLFLIFIVLNISFAQAGGINKDALRYLKAGDKYYSEFNLEQAIKNYKTAFKLAPENYEVFLNLTRTLNDRGEELVELDKEDESEYYFNEAIKTAKLFIKLYPDSSKSNCYLAVSYGNLARIKGAKEKLELANYVKKYSELAIKKDSTYIVHYLVLGIYYRELANLSWIERLIANTVLGDVPDATNEQSIEVLKKALAINSDVIYTNYLLAKTYHEMDDKQKEIYYYQRVLNLPEVSFRDKYKKQKAKRRLAQLLDE